MAYSSSSDCGRVTSAVGFRRTPNTQQDFFGQIRSYWIHAVTNDKLPEPGEEEEWSVWLVKPNKMFKHHSLVIESTVRGGSFTIELLVNVDTNQVMPKSRPFNMNDPRYSHLLTFERLGNITRSAISLFQTALDRLEKFGTYNEITNNCQGYCKALAKDYGLDSGMTDAGKIAVGAAVGVGVTAVAAAGLYLLFGGSKEKKGDR